jgi:hypothetical protein
MCHPPLLPIHRTEREVLQVLSTASTSIASDLEVFWSAYGSHDWDGNGYLDISEMSRFFKNLFKVYGRGVANGSVIACCWLIPHLDLAALYRQAAVPCVYCLN